MSAYSEQNFKASSYNSFRPRYPSSFYTILRNYIKKSCDEPLEMTIDLGCGTGHATAPLTEFSSNVLGTDPSLVMIETAAKENKRKNLTFKTGSAEELSSFASPNSVDLITAAECIHWFKDYPKFFRECANLLKTGGCLAYWFYNEPFIVDFTGPCDDKESTLQEALTIYNNYVHDDPNLIGPHWQQPGRGILRDLLRLPNSSIPHDLYTDVLINQFEPGKEKLYPSDTDLDIQKSDVTLSQLMEYVGTFSALHSYAGSDEDKRNKFLQDFQDEFKSKLGWTDETRLTLVYSTGYTFMRKK